MQTTKAILVKAFQRNNLHKRNFVLNELDIAVNAYSEKLSKQLQDDPCLHIYDIPFVSDPKLLELLQHIYTKPIKTNQDILFIQHYLTIFQTLIVTLFNKKLLTDPKILFSKIAMYLNYEKLAPGSIICRYGDPGDKFYLIFSGKIAVIVTEKHQVKMNEIDYVKYLNSLCEIKEYELAIKTINSNIFLYASREIYDLKDKLTQLQENLNNKDTAGDSKLNKLASKTKEKNYDVVPVEEYIKRVIPKESVPPKKKDPDRFALKKKEEEEEEVIKEEEELNEVTTWIYFQVAKLEESQTFGDVALSDAISKRTASIICLEDSAFGSLNLNLYKKCIRTSQEGIRKKNIECILNNPLFEGITIDAFNKKYFNYFRLVELRLGDCLFAQGTKRTELFFLKEGEIELVTSSSLNDLNNIMEHLGLEIPSKEKELEMQEKSIILRKQYTQIKSNTKLVIYNQRNAIGLDDCIYNDNYFITAKCKSQKAALYAVNYHYFLEIIHIENRLEKNMTAYLHQKNSIMVSRLNQIKEMALTSQLNPINDDYYPNKDHKKCNRMDYKKSSSILSKTLINRNFIKEKLLTERDIRSNNRPSKQQMTICIKDTPTSKVERNITHDYGGICPTNTSISQVDDPCKINRTTPSDRKMKILNKDIKQNKVLASKMIALNYDRNQQLNTDESVIKEDTTLGKYIGQSGMINKSKMPTKIIIGSTTSKKQIIKLHLEDNKSSILIEQKKKSLLCSNIDCLDFYNAMRKTQPNTIAKRLLKGTNFSLKLPIIN